MKKQIAAAAAMLLLGLHMTAPMQQVCAETDPDCMLCAEDQGLNLDAHNYRAWAAPVHRSNASRSETILFIVGTCL